MKYLIQFFFKGKPTQGFTLIELLVVIVMAGVLFGIAAPSFLALVSRQRLNTAQSAVLNAIRDAQSKAKKDKINYQVSFRENNGAVQYVVHPTPITSACSDAASCSSTYNALNWSTLDQDNNKNILMRGVSTAYTAATATCTTATSSNPTDPIQVNSTFLPGVRSLQFNFKGNFFASCTPNPFVLVVLKSKGGDGNRRCVTIATLLGATRTLREGESSCPNYPN